MDIPTQSNALLQKQYCTKKLMQTVFLPINATLQHSVLANQTPSTHTLQVIIVKTLSAAVTIFLFYNLVSKEKTRGGVSWH